MKPRKIPKPELVRVCPESRDASRDYWITKEDGQRLFDEGVLDIDATNSRPGLRVYMPALTKRGKV